MYCTLGWAQNQKINRTIQPYLLTFIWLLFRPQSGWFKQLFIFGPTLLYNIWIHSPFWVCTGVIYNICWMHCYSNFQVWLIFFLLIAKSKAIAIFVHDLNLQNFLYCRGYFTLRCLVVLLCFPPPLSQASWLFQKDWITASTTLQQAWNFAQKSFLFSTSDKDIPSAAAVNLSPSSRIHKKSQRHAIRITSSSSVVLVKTRPTKKHACPTCIQDIFKLVFQFWLLLH